MKLASWSIAPALVFIIDGTLVREIKAALSAKGAERAERRVMAPREPTGCLKPAAVLETMYSLRFRVYIQMVALSPWLSFRAPPSL